MVAGRRTSSHLHKSLWNGGWNFLLLAMISMNFGLQVGSAFRDAVFTKRGYLVGLLDITLLDITLLDITMMDARNLALGFVHFVELTHDPMKFATNAKNERRF